MALFLLLCPLARSRISCATATRCRVIRDDELGRLRSRRLTGSEFASEAIECDPPPIGIRWPSDHGGVKSRKCPQLGTYTRATTLTQSKAAGTPAAA